MNDITTVRYAVIFTDPIHTAVTSHEEILYFCTAYT